MAYTLKYAQTQSFTLAGAGATIGDTSIILTSFKSIDGVNLAMSDFGSIGYATIEPNNGTSEEQISFTGVTQNANGTATLTGVKHVLFLTPYTATSGITKAHAGGVKFVISNTSAFYQTIIDYIDGIAISGSPDMTTTTKGIGEEATAAEIDAGTQTGGTAAELVVNPKYLKDSIYYTRLPTADEKAALAGTGTPSASNKYVTNDTLTTSVLSNMGFGDGSDGDVTISGTTTLTRDMYYNDLVVTGTLNTANFRVFIKGTLSGNGTIQNNGNNGSAGSAGVAGGAGGAKCAADGYFPALAGGAGANGSSGVSGSGAGASGVDGGAANPSIASAGASGGAGGQGGGGGGGAGAAGTKTASIQPVGLLKWQTLACLDVALAGTTTKWNSSSGSGSGGAGGYIANSNSYASGSGGGAGSPGGIVFIMVKTFTGTVTIKSTGGNGGNGGTGTGSGSARSGGGGGGAGGSGGATIVIYGTKTWTGSYVVTGGTGGTGGGHYGSASDGSNGTAGSSGVSYELSVISLT